MFSKGVCQMICSLSRVWSCRNGDFSIDASCVQVGSRTQNCGLAMPHSPGDSLNRGKGIVFISDNLRHFLHPDLEMLLLFKRLPHPGRVLCLICLRTKGVNRGSF